jgi:hypothetical protein
VYEQAERIGDSGLRASLGDQLFIRRRLAEGVPSELRNEFSRKADQLIELAFWGGIAVALAHMDSAPGEIANAIARAQEWAV